MRIFMLLLLDKNRFLTKNMLLYFVVQKKVLNFIIRKGT